MSTISVICFWWGNYLSKLFHPSASWWSSLIFSSYWNLFLFFYSLATIGFIFEFPNQYKSWISFLKKTFLFIDRIYFGRLIFLGATHYNFFQLNWNLQSCQCLLYLTWLAFIRSCSSWRLFLKLIFLKGSSFVSSVSIEIFTPFYFKRSFRIPLKN